MFINGMEFTVGADPEVFVTKDNEVLSAFGLVQGSKFKPHKVERGAVQVDGMALEFNIDPASTEEEFQTNLTTVQKQLAEMIGDFQFTEAVSHIFDEGYMKTQPLEAVLLGCNPDYNGYTMGENDKPDEAGTMRTVGGHVHIGGIDCVDPFESTHFENMGKLARVLDEELGVYSILWDKDDKRRSMYGQAGAFRPKKYGMEYRTLSNSWIFKPQLVSFVYDSVRRSIEKMFDLDYEPNHEVRTIINTSDRSNPYFKGNERADYIRDLVGA